jgi:Replication factor RFC1 C terminal domain
VMDEYFLNKEDWDTLVELGVGDRKDETILKSIPTNTKTAFTKAYVPLIRSRTYTQFVSVITPRTILSHSIKGQILVYQSRDSLQETCRI